MQQRFHGVNILQDKHIIGQAFYGVNIRLGRRIYTDGTFVYSSTSFNHFIGVIDQVRFFDKNLDDDEVVVFANNYLSDLDGLVSWYKFNTYKETIDSTSKKIRLLDLILETPIILPTPSNLTDYNTNNTNTDGIDTENFTGIITSGNNTISIILDIPKDYSKQEMNIINKCQMVPDANLRFS